MLLNEPINLSIYFPQNAYLSKQGCSGVYTRDKGITYIGNPYHTDKSHIDPLEQGTSSFLK